MLEFSAASGGGVDTTWSAFLDGKVRNATYTLDPAGPGVLTTAYKLFSMPVEETYFILDYTEDGAFLLYFYCGALLGSEYTGAVGQLRSAALRCPTAAGPPPRLPLLGLRHKFRCGQTYFEAKQASGRLVRPGWLPAASCLRHPDKPPGVAALATHPSPGPRPTRRCPTGSPRQLAGRQRPPACPLRCRHPMNALHLYTLFTTTAPAPPSLLQLIYSREPAAVVPPDVAARFSTAVQAAGLQDYVQLDRFCSPAYPPYCPTM